MSRPVEERLRELESELRDLQVLPAAAVRARGRRRGRRQLGALLVAGAVVATTAGIAATKTLGWPDGRVAPQQPAATQSTGAGPVVCVLSIPDSPATVRVRVVDGGAPAGTPDTTAAQLRARRFIVLADINGTTDSNAVGTAALHYGPAAIGAATLLRAELHGNIAMQFDPDRADETIDLILGSAFTRLATMTEVNQALVAAGEPSAPPQCETVVSPTPGR